MFWKYWSTLLRDHKKALSLRKEHGLYGIMQTPFDKKYLPQNFLYIDEDYGSSYGKVSVFCAAGLLILASQRIESVIGDWFGHEDQRHNPPGPIDVSTKRGAPPSVVECFILSWVCGK